MIASWARSATWAIGSTDQTVGNIFRRYPIAPAPEWSSTTTWKEFIRSHMDVLAGTDFFTVEVLTWRGFITYYILFFIEIGSRLACWVASPDTRIRVGWSNWRGTRRSKAPDT